MDCRLDAVNSRLIHRTLCSECPCSMRRIAAIITAKYAVIMTYIHELADWPGLRWSDEQLAQPLAAVRHRQGRLIGHMEALGFPLRAEAVLQALTEDVIKSRDRKSVVVGKSV